MYYALELAKIESASFPSVSYIGYAIAGFLVGFGTRLGHGCTSGHGICGLARLSKRSFAAVMTFMATAILTASLLSNDGFLTAATDSSMFLNLRTFCMCMSSSYRKKIKGSGILEAEEESNYDKSVVVGVLAASIFSVGLAIKGVVKQYKVFGFLDMKRMTTGTWDGTLTLVMGGGAVFSAASYHWVQGHNYFGNEIVPTSFGQILRQVQRSFKYRY